MVSMDGAKEEKPETALLLISETGGIGKGKFIKWFARMIIGIWNFVTTANIKQVLDKFNGYISDRKLVHIDECEGESKHDHGELKNLISEATLRMRYMYTDPTMKASEHVVIITSNSTIHPWITNKDRRFAVIHCFEEKMSFEFYKQWEKYANDQENANKFYSYLLSIDLSD